MWLFFLFLTINLSQADAIISQVVGQAGDFVVTSREVKINHFIETVIFSDEKAAAAAHLKDDEKRFDKEVNRTLLEIAVSREADVFNAAQIPDEDVSKTVSLVRGTSSRPVHADYWSKLSPTQQELKTIVLQKLRAKRFIQFKTRASIVPVTDAEALQYYQKNRSRFGNAPFAQFKESIKSLLSQEQANQRLRDWFELLQRKYRVRKITTNATNQPS